MDDIDNIDMDTRSIVPFLESRCRQSGYVIDIVDVVNKTGALGVH